VVSLGSGQHLYKCQCGAAGTRTIADSTGYPHDAAPGGTKRGTMPADLAAVVEAWHSMDAGARELILTAVSRVAVRPGRSENRPRQGLAGKKGV